MIKPRSLLLFLFLLFQLSVVAQKIIKVEPDSLYIITPDRYKKPLAKDFLPFKKIVELPFSDSDFNREGIEKEYWGRFQLKVDSLYPFKTLGVLFEDSDEIIFFVPQKSGRFKEYRTGLLLFDAPLTEFYEASSIIIDVTAVDFTKPFYFKNIPKTLYGTKNINSDIKIETFNSRPVYHQAAYKDSKYNYENNEFLYAVLIGMMIISFVFVLLHYLITRKIYFLFYSIYMFCLIFNYGYRTFYFYNIYADIKPALYFYFNQNGQLLAQLAYMFFFRSFIDMKNKYKKLNRVFSWSINIFIGFIIIYYIFISVFPHTNAHIKLMGITMVVFSITNLVSALYALIKKGTPETKIIIIGGLFLAIGYIVAVKINFFVFLPIVVLETVIFMSVLSYLDLKKNKVISEAEKQKEMEVLKSNFYSNITHEFRTPLTLITAPIQGKLENEELSETDRVNFEMMLRNSDRLLRLVDELLDISKIESGTLKLQICQGDVLDLLSITANQFRLKADQKQLNYLVQIGKGTYAWYDDNIIRKIITNILSNAFKYTPEQGTIIFDASIQEDKLLISVKNTGKGLTKKQLERVFERFYQVNENEQGNGIGLAFVKELVMLHKGTIKAESEPNGWTLFLIEIPIGKKDFLDSEILEKNNKQPTLTKGENKPTEHTPPLTERNKNLPILLIVEDHKDLRIFLKNTFENQYKIITAKNGQEGIDLALEHIPDIIISDIMMPIKDGITLTKELKDCESTSHIPIILLTAKVGEENELRGIKLGADDYIMKPFNTRILISKIENIIKHRQKLRDIYSQGKIFRPVEIATTSRDEQFLLKVEAILNKKLEDSSFSVEEFSQLLGMSRMQLHRKLDALIGLSTTEFIRDERLKWAVLLLKNPDLTISEIGYKVGFSSIPYFNSCFKKKYNCTPSEYRSSETENSIRK